MTSKKSPKVKRTEAEMLNLLRARHGEVGGNGESAAFVTHVRSAAGFDSRRTLDGIAMSLWPSRGLLLDGFEIKCHRSDWLRELKVPEKAEEFCRLLDRFWIVAGDDEIVKANELPDGWGLLVPRGKALATVVQPAMLHDHEGKRIRPLPPGFGRSFLAALLREAVRVGDATPGAINEAREQGYENARREAERSRRSYEPLYTELQREVREFEQAAGIMIKARWAGHDAKAVGEAVRVVLTGERDYEDLQGRLRSLARTAETIAAEATRHANALTDVSGQES